MIPDSSFSHPFLHLLDLYFTLSNFQDGQVSIVEESIARKKKTSDANLFLVPFDRYNLSDLPLSLLKVIQNIIYHSYVNKRLHLDLSPTL